MSDEYYRFTPARLMNGTGTNFLTHFVMKEYGNISYLYKGLRFSNQIKTHGYQTSARPTASLILMTVVCWSRSASIVA